MSALLAVWTPASVLASIIAGVGVGYWVVGRLAANPAWASTTATPHGLGWITGVYSIYSGAVFYLGQGVATYLDGDPNWPRVVSRFSLWIVYALCLGFGTWWRVRHHIDGRKASAREQAARELHK